MAIINGTNNGEILTGGADDDTINGLGGADQLNGAGGADTLNGGDGNDTLDGGAGNDVLNGDAGTDTARYISAGAGVTVSLALQGVQQDTIGAGHDTLNSIERLIGSNFDDVFSGGGLNDRISGGNGNDQLSGGDGNDTLLGGDGNDTLTGGDGIDIADFNDSGSGVGVNLNIQGEAQGTQAGFDTLISIEGLSGSGLADSLVGNGGENILLGQSGNDYLTGNGGNDTLYGGLGDDYIDGSEGEDTAMYADVLAGVSVNLSLSGYQTTGGSGSDWLISIENLSGSSFNDVLTGNAFDNVLTGLGGNDTLNGGDGVDTANYETAASAVSVSLLLQSVQQDTSGAGRDTLTAIESLAGSAFGDTLTGDANDNGLTGRGGNDNLDGGGGNDTAVFSGARSDYTVVEDGSVITITDNRQGSNDGVDTVTGVEFFRFSDGVVAANDLVDHPTIVEKDTLLVTRGVESDLALSVLTANDSFPDGAEFVGVSNVQGAQVTVVAGRLHILATGATASFDYSISSDGGPVTGQVTVQTVLTTKTIDTVAASPSADAVDLQGLGGNDSLTGVAGDDHLVGGDGNDTLDGGAGLDLMAGGAGNDTYFIGNAGDVVVEKTGEGIDTIKSTVNTTLAANVEKLVLLGSALQGTGNELDNTLTGNELDNVLNGLAGHDIMYGGLGNDIYYVDDSLDVIKEAGTGVDTVRSTANQYTLGALVENLVFEGVGDFTGTGNGSNNSITGAAGIDHLDGGAGNDELHGGVNDDVLIGGAGLDTLDGGAGADSLSGGLGNDTYLVDNVGDQVIESAAAGVDQVRTSLNAYTLTANVEDLVFTGSGALTAYGNALANNMMGGTGPDTLYGMEGNDHLFGGVGATRDTLDGGDGNDVLDGGDEYDTMIGGAGNDTYYVSEHGDTVIEEAGGGIDTVVTTYNFYTADAEIENVTYTGAASSFFNGNGLNNILRSIGGADDFINGGLGNDQIFGGAGSDTEFGDEGVDKLYGEQGNDTLNGYLGNDSLIGGAGADQLIGGAGRDSFIFNLASESGIGDGARDTIRDFDSLDIIDLRQIDANTAVDGDQAFTFINTGDFTGVAGQLRYAVDSDGGHLYGDVDGNGVADFEILLLGSPVLNSADFLF